MSSDVPSVVGVSSVWFGVGSMGVETSYHAKGGLSIIDSPVHRANLVPSPVESTTTKLATPSHRFIRVLSGDFSRAYINIGVE